MGKKRVIIAEISPFFKLIAPSLIHWQFPKGWHNLERKAKWIELYVHLKQ
jgi:hypothetical protein